MEESMRNLRIALLLLLLAGGLTAVEVRARGGDMSPETEYTADSLLQEADSLFKKSDYSAALEMYLEVIDHARRAFNRSTETEALAQAARANLVLGNVDEGRRWLEEAAQRASDSDPMGWSRYLGVKGRFQWKDNELAAARKTFDDMYIYCNTNALWPRAVDAAHMIAIVAEKPEEQIEWGKRGIEAAESAGEESWLGPLWNNLATTYYDIKQFDLALDAFIKAREYHWRFSGEKGKLYADYHVGMSYRVLGNLEEAAKWLRPVLAWAERLKDHSAVGQAAEDLGEIELAKGNVPAGLKLLKRAREEYRLAGFDKSWPEVWNNINARIEKLEKE
jgi:tetratricopeptide (TPR) repeat protein